MFFWPKTDVPENNSGRKCYWPYLIDQHPLSPVFGQKRPGILTVIATLLSFYPFLAISCSVFGHFLFLSVGLLTLCDNIRKPFLIPCRVFVLTAKSSFLLVFVFDLITHEF